LLGKTTTCVSAATTLIGLILLLFALDTPLEMGKKIAMALVSLFYGATLHLLFIQPALYKFKLPQTEEPARIARIKNKEAIDKLVQLCFEKGLTYEDIMEADDIQLRRHQ
jgi:hypothetical protein